MSKLPKEISDTAYDEFTRLTCTFLEEACKEDAVSVFLIILSV